MSVFLIECGNYYILWVQEQCQYYRVDLNVEYLHEFLVGDLHYQNWQSPCAFDEGVLDDVLQLFYLPEHNAAVIAKRDCEGDAFVVYNKHRLNHIKSLFFNKL